jgi:hypothetical protein
LEWSGGTLLVKERSRGNFVPLPASLVSRTVKVRSAEAREVLEPVYRRFTEGFETADLKTAKTILDGLRLD